MKKNLKHWVLYFFSSLVFVFSAAYPVSFFKNEYFISKMRKNDGSYQYNTLSYHKPEFKDKKTLKVLVLRGGGVFGYVQMAALKKLEEVTGRPISSLFDLVACTSVGCLNAATLLAPDPKHPGHPLVSASYMLEHYDRYLHEIFFRPYFLRIKGLEGLVGPVFSSKRKEAVLESIVHQAKFGQSLVPVLMNAVSLKYHGPRFYASWGGYSKASMAKIMSSASCPPVFFAPCQVQSNSHGENDVLIDGSLFSNNNTLYLVETLRQFYPNKNIIFIDMGTIYQYFNKSLKYPVLAGKSYWYHKIIPMLLDSAASYFHEVLSNYLEQYKNISYYDFTVSSMSSVSEFTVSDASINFMKNEVKNLFVKKAGRFNELKKILIEDGENG